jgi:tetratricopeptide (TPR) repeat protein
MKAERRHELQTNTLAQFLTDLPLYLRFHANKILVGIIIVCLLILLIRHRINTAAEAKTATSAALQTAELGIGQLKLVDQRQGTDVAKAQDRRKIVSQITTAIDQVMSNTDETKDAAIRANASLIEADMYWTLASLPALPGAASQPALTLQSPSESLKAAEIIYQRVLQNYDNLKYDKAAALLGLAAIEENRGNWDKAIDYYNRLNADAAIPQIYKNVATSRIKLVPDLKTPIYIGTFSATQPTSAPSTTQSAGEAATQPTTQAIVAPTTAPASQPQ